MINSMKNKNFKILFSLFIITLSGASLAQTKKIGPEIDPYTFIHTGSFKFDNADEGDYSGFGLGGRIGFATEHLWFGFDGMMVKPDFSSNGAISQASRDANPLMDNETLVALGAGLGLKLQSLGIYFTYYLDQKYKGTVTDRATKKIADYTYYGKGYKISANYYFYEGFSVFAEKFFADFDRYSLTADTNGETAVGKTSRPSFKMDAWSFGISYKIRLSMLDSLTK